MTKTHTCKIYAKLQSREGKRQLHQCPHCGDTQAAQYSFKKKNQPTLLQQCINKPASLLSCCETVNTYLVKNRNKEI